MDLKVQYLENYNKEQWGLVSSKDGDSGYDLRAAISEPITLKSGERRVVPNGIKVQLESEECGKNVEIQIRSRSGLAAKKGIAIVNGPGTIDVSYTGQIQTILLNTGTEPFDIQPGDRIAQMVVCPIYKPNVVEVDSLEETDRSTKGFGSSGVK